MSSERISIGLALASIGANFVPQLLPRLGRPGEIIARLLAVVLLGASIVVFLWGNRALLILVWCVAFLLIAVQILRSTRQRRDAQRRAEIAEGKRVEAERAAAVSAAVGRDLEARLVDAEAKLLTAEKARQDAEHAAQASTKSTPILARDREQIGELKAQAGHVLTLFTSMEHDASDHHIHRLIISASTLRHYPGILEQTRRLETTLRALLAHDWSVSEFQAAVARAEAAYQALIHECDRILRG